MRPLRILVDMDGIIADLLGEWLAVYNDAFDDQLTTETVNSWHIWDCVKPSCSKETLQNYIRRPGFFDDLAPLPGGIEGVKELHALGHTIRFATAPAGPDSARAKMAWLDRHFRGSGLTSRESFLCHDKDWITADLIIDDKPETLLKWPEFTATIKYPYNAHLDAVVDCMASDYSDTGRAWAQIVDFVKQLES